MEQPTPPASPAPSAYTLNERLYRTRLEDALTYKTAGKITKSVGLVFEAHLPGASVGSLCRILYGSDPHSLNGVDAEVIGFREKRTILMPFEEVYGVNNDSLVLLMEREANISVGPSLLGRVLDGRGLPLDEKGPIFQGRDHKEYRNIYAKPSHVLHREPIREPLDLGIRSINGLLTTGKGQRVGIMAGSGVGKSVLLGMMAKSTRADVNVIALIGERGREVREFIDHELGPEGLKRSVLVVATSDKSALQRIRAAFIATTIAEYFREQGADVLLMMDSLTRFSMAQREIGLSMGEPPTAKGYTPSVFSLMPKLLERAGTAPKKGSITGLYTVLVEGDDLDEPIADAARSILDGHIVLSRKIAQRNLFPAVDVLQSASRVMNKVIRPEHKEWAGKIREWMALYNSVEDLINIGAYVKGSNKKVDEAIAVHDRIIDFMRQDKPSTFDEALAMMYSIVRAAEAHSK